MQVAYDRARVGSRAAEWINPKRGELLIPDRETAYRHIASFERQLQAKLPRHKRAELLIAKSLVCEAIGDQKMMEAAEEAFALTKTSTTAHMMAVAHHHFGRIQEACSYYELAYRFPHEAGFNVDLAYAQALLFQGKWSEAHMMTLGLKKRMVYAAYLPEWNRRSKTLSIVSEGGFGDLIQCGRWIPIIKDMGINVTVYLPPFFFNAGFVDLWKRQPWCPPIKLLTETPKDVPAVGFFDLPAVFDVQPGAIPPSLTFKADPELVKEFADVRQSPHPLEDIPTIGFCWQARQQETPLVPPGVYRELTLQQAQRILNLCSQKIKVRFTCLQKNPDLDAFSCTSLNYPGIRNWEDTAAIIENLDAVITVDTAVAHIAAAMGKPTYVLLSGASDWKFGMSGETTPWYPSMKLIRNDGWGFENAVEKVISLIENGQLHNETLGHN